MDISYHKVIDGIVEEIKIDNDVYRLVKDTPECTLREISLEEIPLEEKLPESHEIISEEKEITPHEVRFEAHRGRKIDTYHGFPIHENILNNVKELVLRGEGDTINLRKIIKKYNPLYKASTLYTQASIYRKYVNEKQQKAKGRKLGVMKGNVIYENILNDIMIGIDEGKRYSEIEKIMAQYYPGCKKLTYRTYVKCYRRWHNEFSITEETSNRGKIITRLGGNDIYENILVDINQAIKEGKGNEDLMEIIKAYHPDAKPSSHLVYLSAYRRHNQAQAQFENQDQLENKPLKIRKKRKRKPKDCIGYSKKYKVWINKKEYIIVKKAVCKWNFTATSYSLSELTDIPIWRVRTILDFLQQKHEIYMTFKNKQRIYYPTA